MGGRHVNFRGNFDASSLYGALPLAAMVICAITAKIKQSSRQRTLYKYTRTPAPARKYKNKPSVTKCLPSAVKPIKTVHEHIPQSR